MSQGSSKSTPVIACHECGDLISVGRAYFTGIDGRMLPLPEVTCPPCHENAVRNAAKAHTDTKVIKSRFG